MGRVDDFSRRGNVFDKIAETLGGGIPSEKDGEGEVWKGRVPQVCPDTDDETVGGEGQWAVG